MPMSLKEAEALTPFWSEADLLSLQAFAERVGLPVSEVVLPLASESKLDPKARNPVDPKAWPLAVGIAQFTRKAAIAMGLIPDGDPSYPAWRELAQKILDSPVGMQLYLFETFLASTGYGKGGGVWDSPTRIYQAIAAPGSMIPGSKPTKDTVLYEAGSVGYEGNRALDLNGDGKITYGDLMVAVESMRKHKIVEAVLRRLEPL